jgi:hypothetical protein
VSVRGGERQENTTHDTRHTHTHTPTHNSCTSTLSTKPRSSVSFSARVDQTTAVIARSVPQRTRTRTYPLRTRLPPAHNATAANSLSKCIQNRNEFHQPKIEISSSKTKALGSHGVANPANNTNVGECWPSVGAAGAVCELQHCNVSFFCAVDGNGRATLRGCGGAVCV